MPTRSAGPDFCPFLRKFDGHSMSREKIQAALEARRQTREAYVVAEAAAGAQEALV